MTYSGQTGEVTGLPTSLTDASCLERWSQGCARLLGAMGMPHCYHALHHGWKQPAHETDPSPPLPPEFFPTTRTPFIAVHLSTPSGADDDSRSHGHAADVHRAAAARITPGGQRTRRRTHARRHPQYQREPHRVPQCARHLPPYAGHVRRPRLQAPAAAQLLAAHPPQGHLLVLVPHLRRLHPHAHWHVLWHVVWPDARPAIGQRRLQH